MTMTYDSKFMQRALTLARRGLGRTSPNPLVGCVIVKRGKVIAEGWHKGFGFDHAEVDALRKAGSRARGASLYVTLEPCSHWGKTPPCVKAILDAGVKRVVVAMKDPNPVNNGRSLQALGAKGVQVTGGVCEGEAQAMNAPFTKFITKKMPYVIAKTAQTLDGKIATSTGDSKWISSLEERLASRKRRNEFDAIMVGINTVLLDDPRLNAPAKRLRKIIVDSRLRIPQNARLLKGTQPGQVIIATTQRAPKGKLTRLRQAGADIIICPSLAGKVDLKRLFKELAKRKIASILIEGGAAVVGAAMKAGLVDKYRVYIAAKVLGDSEARSSIVGLNILKVAKAKKFSIETIERIGPDVFMELKVV
jgi:diaminohydroxyphosphoribosylaminopyrimidine deaminase / 5-amino-6-(5-phosphoribosylamino)uracil reductase